MLPIISKITREVVTCNKDTSILEAVKIMAGKNIGSIVIAEDNRPIGIFTERDLLTRVVAKEQDTSGKISDVMTTELIVAEENDSCSSVYMKMQKKQIWHMPIVKDDKLNGIISLKNVISLMNEIIAKCANPADFSGMY